MSDRELTGAQKKELRGIAQRLKPAVLVGKNGLTDEVWAELERAFEKNELIKIRFSSDRDTIKELCEEIEGSTDSTFLSAVGKTASFFKLKEAEEEDDAY